MQVIEYNDEEIADNFTPFETYNPVNNLVSAMDGGVKENSQTNSKKFY